MIPLSLPAASGANPSRFKVLVLAIIALAIAHLTERTVYWSSHWHMMSSSHAASAPVTLKIGDAGFHLPLDYIAINGQRKKAVGSSPSFSALKLAMTWPGLAPVNGPVTAFTSGSAETTLLVELEHNPGRESMRARLDPFYRRLARGGELNGPDGLKILTLSALGATGRDLIAYDPARRNGFIARCLTNKSGREPTCHRAIVLSSGLELRYRFNQDLLADWRQIDSAIIRKVSAFRSG